MREVAESVEVGAVVVEGLAVFDAGEPHQFVVGCPEHKIPVSP